MLLSAGLGMVPCGGCRLDLPSPTQLWAFIGMGLLVHGITIINLPDPGQRTLIGLASDKLVRPTAASARLKLGVNSDAYGKENQTVCCRRERPFTVASGKVHIYKHLASMDVNAVLFEGCLMRPFSKIWHKLY